jgi:tRNA threonylcarbamoyladenosine biosynthesis protein TsaB
MKILALDTSSNACSAVLFEGKQLDFTCIERFEVAPRQHTQLILSMIDSVLDEAGYDIKQIDVLAFGRGPGAFTGVRIATGVVQAIAYGADIPVAQISSLAAIAQGFYVAGEGNAPKNKLLIANDARMAEIYFASYEMKAGFMTLTHREQVLKPEQLGSVLESSIHLNDSWVTVGNGWSVYDEQLSSIASQCYLSDDKNKISEASSYPHARDIAYLALKDIADKNLVSAEQVRPVYLRDNVAKKPRKKN